MAYMESYATAIMSQSGDLHYNTGDGVGGCMTSQSQMMEDSQSHVSYPVND